MDDIKEIFDYTARKASLISLGKESRLSNAVKDPNKAPPDKWNMCYVIFFFYGLGSFLPLPFIANGQDYWMYKFRDTSMDQADSNNRTALQANFLSSLSLSQIPATVACMLFARYGHKIEMRKRLVHTMFLLTFTFVLLVVFIKVNTDTWQFGFYILTLIISAVGMISGQIFNLSQMALISRFPNKYLKAQMYGQSLGCILSSILQIIALTIGNDSPSKALIYFISGTTLLVITYILCYVSRYFSCYTYYEGDSMADTERSNHTMEEYKDILLRTWPLIVIALNLTIGMAMSFPTVANLVVSEYYDYGYAWNVTYFPIVITYLMPEVLSIASKYLASPIITPKNAVWWVLAHCVITYTTSPLFLFCNAQPRPNGLIILLSHDWEYIVLMFSTAVIRTYFLTISFLSMSNLAKEQTELGFVVYTTITQIASSGLSPLNSLFVNIL